MSPTNTFFTVASALSLVLVCLPLSWHLEAWNTGTCLMIFWTATGLFVSFINSILWSHDALVRVPVWCDITTKLAVGWSVGIPAALLCINRRLYIISSVRVLKWTKAEKMRAVLTELAIGLLTPIIVMALHYIPQGHRFDLFEEVGCVFTTSSTWVSFLIVYLPPLIFSLISLYYAVMCFLHLHKCHKESSAILSSTSVLSSSRYFRLMALTSMELLLSFPFHIIMIVMHKSMFRPWISWEETHYNFGRISKVPSVLWKGTHVGREIEFSRWLLVVCALIFFAFFGLAEEARKNYRSAIDSISKRVGASPTTSSFSAGFKFGSVTSSVGRFKATSTDGSNGIKSNRFVFSKILEKRNSNASLTTIEDTEVSTLHTLTRSNTPIPTKDAQDGNNQPIPTSPSAAHESFLELSSDPETIHFHKF